MERSFVFCLLRPLTCVFGRFAIRRSRIGTPLPSMRRLSMVALIRGLSWTRIWTCRSHWTRRVILITCVGLHHVWLWGVTMRWHLARVAGSSGTAAVVRRGLLKIHDWLKSSPKKTEVKEADITVFMLFAAATQETKNVITALVKLVERSRGIDLCSNSFHFIVEAGLKAL